MAIYTKKNNERIINSTITVDPGCYVGNKVVKFRASVERQRTFYLTELIADKGPEEITALVNAVVHPEQTIKPLWELERDAILNALTLLNGNKLAAARALGIAKTTLYRKLREHEPTPQHPLYQKMKQSAKK